MAEGTEESAAAAFRDLARIFTPARDEIEAVLLQLIPARSDERFCFVDIGASDGWLSQRTLERYCAAQGIAIDGSTAMVARARHRLAHFGARSDVRQFRLEDNAWISGLPGGALLIADVIAPGSESEKRYFAAQWDADVKRQSTELTGNSAAFDLFDGEQWNRYRYADSVDKSTRLLDQMKWLDEVGFAGRRSVLASSRTCGVRGLQGENQVGPLRATMACGRGSDSPL